MDNQYHDSEILEHYTRLWGKPSRKFSFQHESKKAPSPVNIFEFAGDDNDPVFVYATVGLSRKEMIHPLGNHGYTELFIQSYLYYEELVDNLGAIAVYPFVMNTYFDEGHLVRGSGEGIVNNSSLTDILIARADFGELSDYIVHRDKSHTHLLWVIPIHKVEREFAVKRSSEQLQDLLAQNAIDLCDFSRTSVV